MSDPRNFSVTHAPSPSRVERAIAHAASRTGIDFDYLLAQAEIESGLDVGARAPTSSASGLYQFIESTWLETMRRHGGEFGLGKLSDAITISKGRAQVSDPRMRSRILALRNDPETASFMAAKLAQDNRAALRPVLGREPDPTELYLAHFLGSSGAGRFLSALEDKPDHAAASLFPKAARANRAIFYLPGGGERTLQQVMAVMRNKVSSAMSSSDNFANGVMAGSRGAVHTASATVAGSARARGAPATNTETSHSAFSPMPKISDLLERSFTVAGTADMGHAGDHARRAYAKLKAFDL